MFKYSPNIIVLILSLFIIGCVKELPQNENDMRILTIGGKSLVRRGFGADLSKDYERLLKRDIPLVVSKKSIYTDALGASLSRTSGGSTRCKGKNCTPPPPPAQYAPTVSITSPANGASYTSPATITLTATAADQDGTIAKVEFFKDGVSVGSDTSSPYSITLSSVPDGTYVFSARATDNSGLMTTSSTVTVYVTSSPAPEPPPPTTGFPSSFSLATPPVGNQGGEGSCVPFATGYAARSIEQYYTTSAGSYSNSINVFSPEFLYNQTKFGDCGSGTSITTCLDFMKANGICKWDIMPYDSNNGCSILPDGTQSADAANYKLSTYKWAYASDVDMIKNLLLSHHAVIAGLVPDNGFLNAGPSFIWDKDYGGQTAGHAVVIVGWDDAKSAWKVQNSWGTGWGDAGFSWITYNYLPYTGNGTVYVITAL